MNELIGEHYLATQQRLDQLLGSATPQQWATPVPACPGWTVHDTVAHLVGVIEDAAAGRLSGIPDDAQTSQQVTERRNLASSDLTERWRQLAPPFAERISAFDIWPAMFDAVSHEHDIRSALASPESPVDPATRDTETVRLAARRLIWAITTDAVVEFDLGHGVERSRRDGEPSYRLSTSAFEVLRFRLGRRSRNQVLALPWSVPVDEIADQLMIFGPASEDLIE